MYYNCKTNGNDDMNTAEHIATLTKVTYKRGKDFLGWENVTVTFYDGSTSTMTAERFAVEYTVL